MNMLLRRYHGNEKIVEETKQEVKPLDEMTKAELQDYLNENNIDYPSDALKPDLLKLAKGGEA